MDTKRSIFSETPDKYRTKSELDSYRKLQNQQNALEISSKHLNFHISSEDTEKFIANFCTYKLKLQERRNARINQGLSPEPDGLSERKLGLHYEAFPKIRTKTELSKIRKNTDSLSEFPLSVLGTFQTPEDRLNQREEKYRFLSHNGKTFRQISTERKQQDMEYNQKIFGNWAIGIHKNELPKFETFKKVYWNNENKLPDIKIPEQVASNHRAIKTKSVDITSKPNETSPSSINPRCYEEEVNKYHKKFEVSKIERLIFNCLHKEDANKIKEGTQNQRKKIKSFKEIKKEREKSEKKESSLSISLNHFRSKGFINMK